jgi:DNA-binding GntR family transcriptional regulator
MTHISAGERGVAADGKRGTAGDGNRGGGAAGGATRRAVAVEARRRRGGGRTAPQRELLADRAYVALRDRIVTLAIRPGEPIDEDRIGAELQIGRTPVREAIKRLALENLVIVFPRRGTFATEINISDLAHISDVRRALEGHAAERAAQRITPARSAELNELLHELGQAPNGDDREHLQALMELDAKIHRFVYACADNPYLEATLDRYFNLSLRIWYLALDRLPHLGARVHEHAALLRAIDDGAPERARAILAEHIETFEREIRAAL